MAYADQQMSGSKITAIVIVALIHIAALYALVTGLAYDAVTKIKETVTAVNITEPEPPPPPPPPPPPDQPQMPPPPVAPPPMVTITRPAPPIQTIPTIPPPSPPAVVIPPPAPPAAPSKARGVSPKNYQRWTRRIIENYPSRAIRNEEEGRVGVRVTVGTNGKATACSVISSSGSSTLDDAACKDIQRYAQFEPALNDAGAPISAQWSTTIVYQLN